MSSMRLSRRAVAPVRRAGCLTVRCVRCVVRRQTSAGFAEYRFFPVCMVLSSKWKKPRTE